MPYTYPKEINSLANYDFKKSAVSYTHLLEAFCDRSDDLLLNGSVALEAYEKREVMIRTISPVSYTHLDVYKRQI